MSFGGGRTNNQYAFCHMIKLIKSRSFLHKPINWSGSLFCKVLEESLSIGKGDFSEVNQFSSPRKYGLFFFNGESKLLTFRLLTSKGLGRWDLGGSLKGLQHTGTVPHLLQMPSLVGFYADNLDMTQSWTLLCEHPFPSSALASTLHTVVSKPARLIPFFNLPSPWGKKKENEVPPPHSPTSYISKNRWIENLVSSEKSVRWRVRRVGPIFSFRLTDVCSSFSALPAQGGPLKWS